VLQPDGAGFLSEIEDKISSRLRIDCGMSVLIATDLDRPILWTTDNADFIWDIGGQVMDIVSHQMDGVSRRTCNRAGRIAYCIDSDCHAGVLADVKTHHVNVVGFYQNPSRPAKHTLAGRSGR